jgi:hypothetical protein
MSKEGREWIVGQLEAVKRERDEYITNAHRCTGAITAFELVLRQLEVEEKGEESTPPTPQEIPNA